MSDRPQILSMSSSQHEKDRRRAAIDWDLLWEKFGIAIVLVLVWIVAALGTPRFANLDNLSSVLRQSAFVGISAIGMTVAIIAGTFDLSVGSAQALSA